MATMYDILTEEYNKEPVYYCKHCLSLKIIGDEQFEYCDDCGSTDVESTDIFTWLKMYKEKYNKEF